ncbi:MAG: ribokinase [Betaproteobacteria bacterium]
MPSPGHTRIVVVGSSNMDLVVRAPRLPARGETLAGYDFRAVPGGKGANQAVAAARLGGIVSLVSCVGTDAFGVALHAGFAADGLDLTHLRRLESVPTGIASITVASDGANSIVLAAGANAELTPAWVEASAPLFADAALLLCQLEVPIETVRHAVALAVRNGTPVILNPAPAMPLNRELLASVDFLVPNETEAGALCGLAVTDVDSARRAAGILLALGPRHVIVTLGARGVWLAGPEGGEHLPAFEVTPIDTTAAGDTFIGGLAVGIAAGYDLRAAIVFGQRAAALSVTRFGAQASIPYRREVDAFVVS